ncbi:MAG: thiolase C-terminal domain-containing protein, partial [Thermoplasmata archaeon]
VYALLADRHAAEYGTPPEALAEVAVKNHRNGMKNPNAHFRKLITREQVLAAARVADPLGLFDCCPVSDGAAAILLARGCLARKFTDTPVFVSGMGWASDALAVQERPLTTGLAASRWATDRAFRHAPFDRRGLSFVEVHDCFTIAELLALEDLGLVEPGGAAAFTLEGRSAMGGTLPVNPDGGLKSKGHPIGATGASQAYEVFQQLRGQAGERQVADAHRALAHNVGGSGASASVTLFEAG